MPLSYALCLNHIPVCLYLSLYASSTCVYSFILCFLCLYHMPVLLLLLLLKKVGNARLVDGPLHTAKVQRHNEGASGYTCSFTAYIIPPHATDRRCARSYSNTSPSCLYASYPQLKKLAPLTARPIQWFNRHTYYFVLIILVTPCKIVISVVRTIAFV